MRLYKEGRKLAKHLLRESIVNGALDAARVRQGADLVVRAKPRNTVGVLKEFARLVRLELAKRQATIESHMELDAREQAEITGALRTKYGADVTAEYKTNPALLGGVRIQ